MLILLLFVNAVMMDVGEDANTVVNAEPPSVEEEAIDFAELERELAATEEDIQTLKEALSIKIKRCVEIKKKLGHTDISTISMQKTQRALLQARSKTIDVAEDVKVKLATSIETLKNTETFKNISETMGSAFDSFKVCLGLLFLLVVFNNISCIINLVMFCK
ncbi:unnamed protein product [Rodentolepis nana]|uniref:Charged multivesicular body protein 2b n=1 Tax=Rodentolepis nana TaxID=102285 RepID=A0A0R3TPU2_RODNA|nr:unnamed protein product [Rodentolepis nana]